MEGSGSSGTRLKETKQGLRGDLRDFRGLWGSVGLRETKWGHKGR